MNVIAISRVPAPCFDDNNGEDEATGFSSEDDFYDDYCDYAPAPPTSSRNWKICEYRIMRNTSFYIKKKIITHSVLNEMHL